jgi:hypothetical protein
MEPPCWKQPFSLIARDALLLTLLAGVPKLRLTLLPTASPYTTPLKITTNAVLSYWLILTLSTTRCGCVCVCVCVCFCMCVCVCVNTTRRIFHPEILYCFRNSIYTWTTTVLCRWGIQENGIETTCNNGCYSAVPFLVDPPNLEEEQ